MSDANEFKLYRPTFRIAIGAVLTIAAFLLRQIMAVHYGIQLPPYITFYPTIMAVALLFGLWLGLLATVLAAALAEYWILPPVGQFTIERTSDAIALALFVAMGIFMSVVAEGYRRSRGRIAAFKREEALRKSAESKYRVLAESITDPVFTMDHELRFNYWNRRTAEITGISAEMALGKTRAELFGESDSQKKADAQCRAALQTQKPIQYENEWVFGGKRHFFDARVFPFDGGVSTIGNDITQRKEADEALRASEAQFHSLADAIPQLCWMANADGWIFWFNQRWYQYTGTTPQQMEGWGWQSVHDPQHLPDVLERWKISIDTGKPFEMVFPLRGADGAFRPFLTRVMPVKDGNGSVVRWFGTNTDITESKRAEDALRDSQARLQGIVNSAMDAVISVNEQQRIIVFNRAAEMIFQFSASEAIGSSLDPFIPEALRAAHGEHIRRFGQEGVTSRSMSSPAVLAAVRSNGEVFPIEATISHVQAAGESVFTVILRDITERQRAQERLRWSEDQLRAFAARLQTASEAERLRISRELHDQMGSALTGMKMDLDWIVHKHGTGGNEWVPLVQNSIRTVDSIIALVRRLSMELRPEMLDAIGLGAAIEWETEQFRRRTGISCVVQVPDSPMGIPSHQKIAMFRIFQEAMTNIARHSQAKNVLVTLMKELDQAVLSIRDDGIGFCVDSLEHTVALGILGMRKRALLLHSPLHITSEPGIGTTITLRIRLDHAEGVERES